MNLILTIFCPKGKRNISLLFILFHLIIINNQNFAQVFPVSLKSDGYRYDQWLKISSKSLREWSVLPSSIKSPRYFTSLRNINNVVFLRIEPSFEVYSSRSPRQSIRGTIVIKLSKGIILQNDFRAMSDPYQISDYIGLKASSVGNWRGDLEQSFIRLQRDGVFLHYGRGWSRRNPLTESLLINPGSPVPEILWLHFEPGKFEFDFQTFFLDPINDMKRIMVSHRFGYRSDHLRIGFSESALLAYKSLGVSDLRYLNPASILFETEVNRGPWVNLMWHIDAVLKLYPWTINSEFLIDDYALDKLSPPKLAFLFGLGYHAPKFGSLYLEYTRINRWVYNYGYDKPELRWVQDMQPIGHTVGPDAHSLKLKLYREILKSENFLGNLELSTILIEHGEGSIFEPTPVKSVLNFGYSSEKFPSGSISHRKYFQCILDILYKNKIHLSGKCLFSSEEKPDFKIKISFLV